MDPTHRIAFNHDSKFDIQLSAALVNERRLAEVFEGAIFAKNTTIELKSETYLWEKTGKICVEYACDGKPSGLAKSEADIWVHELKRGGETLGYLMVPIERMKALAREHYRLGHVHRGGGDGKRFDNVLIPISDILK